MSNAIIIASDNPRISPAPNAAKPDHKGMSVPLIPNVGPNLVTIYVFSIIFAASSFF